jgi:hypothetical protein
MTGTAVGVRVSLGLAGTATQGRGTLPLSAQAIYDRGLAVGLFLSAFALTGDAAAGAIFAAAGAATLAITAVTKYSAPAV